MKPKVVTFDCANTLVRVRWTPAVFALECARAAGLELSEDEASKYSRMLRSRWLEYEEVNQTRDPVLGDAFWVRLTQDWLGEIGQPASFVSLIVQAAPEVLYGKGADMFELFDDVLPTLDALDGLGIRMGVISNWDYSLHRVLGYLNIHHRFEYVVASLEEGVEKPHPRLFELTLGRFGVERSEAVHVGDDPLDDLRGAQEFGMRAYLIDRAQAVSEGVQLATLTDIVAKLES